LKSTFRATVSEAASGTEQAIRRALDEAVVHLTNKQARAARGARFVGLATLVISLAVLAMTIMLLLKV